MRKRWRFANQDFPCRFGPGIWRGGDAVDGYRARHIGPVVDRSKIRPGGAREDCQLRTPSLGNLARRSIGRAFSALQ